MARLSQLWLAAPFGNVCKRRDTLAAIPGEASMAVGACEHVVVLVPGFLSFEAEAGIVVRNGAASVLRSALEAHWRAPVPVVVLAPAPGHNLVTRQRTLLRELQRLDATLRGVRHFHLVGHGPGGLDAELLTVTLPLSPGATWEDLDPQHLRERIASVVTVGAPHYGTQLAEQPAFAAWSARLGASARGYHQAGKLVAAFLEGLGDHARARARSPKRRGGELRALPFLLRLMRHEAALGDLCPLTTQALRAHNAPDPALDVSVQSIVVVAPQVTEEADGELRRRDELFAALHELTAQPCLVEPARALTEALRLLEDFPEERVVRHPTARIPELDFSASDGLVNTARQLLLTRGNHGHALLSVVVADHADVVGYYDQPSAFPSGSQPRPGLLRSGARFGDDEYFHLWGLIAARIAANVEDERGAAVAAQ